MDSPPKMINFIWIPLAGFLYTCGLVICFIFILPSVFGQQIAPAKSGQKVHAVVIGISKYKDTRIPQLQFADRDARLFAEFLKSPSGGNIPAGQIGLLLNEKATFSEIDNKIADLYENVQTGDRVYFYFSGHGDVETRTFANLGFLLAYNTPANNYVRHAIRLEDINLLASTLSTQRNAEVILITDACRSGKLAGGISGSRWVGEALRRVQRNEVRFASCQPNQLSQEGASWGEGRGVFSYYLLNGLYGNAAKPGSNGVTVNDLKKYLSITLSTDRILRANKVEQRPVVSGNLQLRMAENVEKTITMFMAENNAPLPPSPLDIFSAELRSKKLEKQINFLNLTNASAEQIRNRVFDGLSPLMMDENVYRQVIELQRICSTSANAAARTNALIASVISEKGQEVINDYLDGDMAELEKRNYYNIKKGEYDKYVYMYAAALKLLPETHTLYERIKVASLYFEGLLYRLKMPLIEDSKPMLEKALQLQQAALGMEPFAAYIHNELANLYATKGKIDSALYYYDYATKLAPTWAVPLSNMAGLYNGLGNVEKAKEFSAKAREIQPDLVSLQVNEGVTAEIEKNWLKAEEMQLRSIRVNARHYLSYERLGFVYGATARFQMADSLFFEAWQRKKGYFFPKPDSVLEYMGYAPTRMNMPQSLVECPPSMFPENVDNSFLLTVAGKNNTLFNRMTEAEACFKSALMINPDNFLTAQYFGRYLLLQKRYSEAEYYFKKSSALYKTADVKELMGGQYPPIPPEFGISENCFITEIENLQYDSSVTSLFLIQVYEAAGYISQAETICRRLIGTGNLEQGFYGYHRLANLLKRAGQWKRAEQAWIEFGDTFRALVKKDSIPFYELDYRIQWGSMGVELDTFYLEAMDSFPEQEYWAVQGARHWHKKVMSDIANYYFEDRLMEDSLQGITDSINADYYFLKRNLELKQESNYRLHPALKIEFPELVFFPYRVCVATIERAITLATNDETLAELHWMLGDMYNATHQLDKAAEYYAAAIEFQPDNASLRRTTFSAFQKAFRLTEAFNHLDTLRQTGNLLTGDYLPYATMAIHGRQFDQAKNMLEHAAQLFRGTLRDSVMELKARFFFVERDPVAAAFYKDSIQTAMPLADRLYALASLYAMNGDNTNAQKYLTQSLEKGFAYGYLLQNDPVWTRYRNTPLWDSLMQGRTFKRYAITDFSDAKH